MTRRRPTAILGSALTLCLPLLGVTAAPTVAATAAVNWGRLHCSENVGSDPSLLFRCGPEVSYHDLSASPTLPEGCELEAEGHGIPPSYAAPQSTGSSAGYPCSDRACLCRAEACPDDPGPWVAVVDWDNWHGLSQAGLLRELLGAGHRIALFSLADALAGTPQETLEGVTDLHVLARLCQLLEIVATPGAEPPAVTTLSFGRIASCGEGPESGATLEGEIGRALDELRAGGSVPLAAAGNHRRRLFPASHPSTLAVGALDLSRYRPPSFPWAPSWETPAGTDALFPGDGLCLISEAGGDGYWRAPAGASFANAFFAGWLADALSQGALEHSELDSPGPWHPAADSLGSGDFLLARQEVSFASTWSPESSALLGRLLDPGHPCWLGLGLGPSLSAFITADPDPTASLPSPEELACATSAGTPSEDPCVPCMGGTRPGGLESPELLEIDFSATAILTGGVSVEHLVLRVDDERWPLELTPEVLDAINAGILGTLVIEGAALPAAADVSLIWGLSWDTGEGIERYWTSSPVHLPGS